MGKTVAPEEKPCVRVNGNMNAKFFMRRKVCVMRKFALSLPRLLWNTAFLMQNSYAREKLCVRGNGDMKAKFCMRRKVRVMRKFALSLPHLLRSMACLMQNSCARGKTMCSRKRGHESEVLHDTKRSCHEEDRFEPPAFALRHGFPHATRLHQRTN